MEDAQAANNRLATKMMRMDINRILLRWDPLHVQGLHGADREYEPQIGPILVLVKKGADYMEIARHLHDLMKDEWRVPQDREACVRVARKLYNVGATFRGDAPIKD
ncbi:hypothetical protein KQI84_06190 [bacterium]|nr:hypothetical protein [bacterium]